MNNPLHKKRPSLPDVEAWHRAVRGAIVPAGAQPPPTSRSRPWLGGRVIVVDTREQTPYFFPRQQVATLHTGDYSIVGMEDLCCIGRKTLADAWASIGSGCGKAFRERRERFRREWIRMAEMQYAAVVIEATLAQLLRPQKRSQVDPSVVIGTYLGWSVRHRIPVFFAGDRAGGRAVTARLLIAFWEGHR